MKYKKTKRNKDRAERIAATIEAYANGDDQDDITDILTDLRHYAQQNTIDFEYCVRVSQNHFKAEAGGKS